MPPQSDLVSDRMAKLRAMLEKTPDDPFLLYAMGMEQKKSDAAEALRLFRRVIQLDPKQCYAYFQAGQTLESTGDIPAAKIVYHEGIAAAQKFGDAHAAQEIAQALEMIESN